MSVNIDQIVVPHIFNHSDEGFKYFIGHQGDELLNHYVLLYLR